MIVSGEQQREQHIKMKIMFQTIYVFLESFPSKSDHEKTMSYEKGG